MKTLQLIEQELETELEAIIDKHSISQVLNVIAFICSEKADDIHLGEGNRVLAEQWDILASKVLAAEYHANNYL